MRVCENSYDCRSHPTKPLPSYKSKQSEASSNYYVQVYDLPTDYVKVAPKYFSINDYYDNVQVENQTLYSPPTHGYAAGQHARSSAAYEHPYRNFSQNASGPLPNIPNFPASQKVARFAECSALDQGSPFKHLCGGVSEPGFKQTRRFAGKSIYGNQTKFPLTNTHQLTS